MATKHPNHAELTAAAKLCLERVRNNWVGANAIGGNPDAYHFDGQAKGIFDLWCEATGVAMYSQDWVALDQLVKSVTASKR
jgi:hypothetical protein